MPEKKKKQKVVSWLGDSEVGKRKGKQREY